MQAVLLVTIILTALFWNQIEAVVYDPAAAVEEEDNFSPDEESYNDDDDYISTVLGPNNVLNDNEYRSDYEETLYDKKPNLKKLPFVENYDNINVPNNIILQNRNEDIAAASGSCYCKNRVNLALIISVKSCLNVLIAKIKCRNYRYTSTAAAVELMSSCSCCDKVSKALFKSLKSCTEALKYSLTCKSISPSSSFSSSQTPFPQTSSVFPSFSHTRPSPTPSPTPLAHFTSCSEIKRANRGAPSGYYNLVINGTTVRVYCNMSTLCNSNAGWTLLSRLDMTNSSSSCPAGLNQFIQNGVRVCRRPPSNGGGCNSFNLSLGFVSYSRVCGRVRGYQYGHTDGLHQGSNINSPYLEGVSITHGSPRRHIWSFASGYTESTTSNIGCPCNTGASNSSRPPSFVDNNYYCESGFTRAVNSSFAITDPLWDGRLCRSNETPCCTSSLLPWFDRNLTAPTTDVEVRLCTDFSPSGENIAIDQFEFYVM